MRSSSRCRRNDLCQSQQQHQCGAWPARALGPLPKSNSKSLQESTPNGTSGGAIHPTVLLLVDDIGPPASSITTSTAHGALPKHLTTVCRVIRMCHMIKTGPVVGHGVGTPQPASVCPVLGAPPGQRQCSHTLRAVATRARGRTGTLYHPDRISRRRDQGQLVRRLRRESAESVLGLGRAARGAARDPYATLASKGTFELKALRWNMEGARSAGSAPVVLAVWSMVYAVALMSVHRAVRTGAGRPRAARRARRSTREYRM